MGPVPIWFWQPAAPARPAASRTWVSFGTCVSLHSVGVWRGDRRCAGLFLGHDVGEAEGGGPGHDDEDRGEDEEDHGEEELDRHFLGRLLGPLGAVLAHA